MKPPLLFCAISESQIISPLLSQGMRNFILKFPGLTLSQKSSDLNLDELMMALGLISHYRGQVWLALDRYFQKSEWDYLKSQEQILTHICVEGIIIHDPGLISWLKALGCRIILAPLQQVWTLETALFWGKQGIDGFILPVDITLDALKELRASTPDLQIYMYTHGQTLQAVLPSRSINKSKSGCQTSCSKIMPSEDPWSENLLVWESSFGVCISEKEDLCRLQDMDVLKKIGVNALIVEGNGRSWPYLLRTASIYQKVLVKGLLAVSEDDLNDLQAVSQALISPESGEVSIEYVACVIESGAKSVLEVLSQICQGDELEWVMGEQKGKLTLDNLICFDGEWVKSLEAGRFFIMAQSLTVGTLLRRYSVQD